MFSFSYFQICNFLNIFAVVLIIAHPANAVHHLETSIANLILEMNLTIEDPSHLKDKMISIDNKMCSYERASQKIIACLKTFDGISANNFFNVKRSLLTSILAHFTTYFIILLQFRVAENFPNDSVNKTE